MFDFDDQWRNDPGWVKYDFHEPTAIPEHLHHTFDFVVVDPPFVTRDAWTLYATTVKLLLRENGKIIVTTLSENEEMMAELLGVKPQRFQPSIPHLVYQYKLYTNYNSPRFAVANPEVPD